MKTYKQNTKKRSKPEINELNISVRLNKFIADSGLTSRRKADDLISSGMVTVNGKTIYDLGTKVNLTDRIIVDGNAINYKRHLTYIALNKPKNIITTTNDELGRDTVLDIVRVTSRIFPVGRLDRNTTGLLLLTNDGEMANRLLHPKYLIERVYCAGLDKILLPEHAQKISNGVELEDGVTSPCEIFIDTKNKSLVTIILTEGRNHEVKRLFEAFGYFVKKLDRRSYAGITTKNLARGEYRHLTKFEIQKLKKLTGLY